MRRNLGLLAILLAVLSYGTPTSGAGDSFSGLWSGEIRNPQNGSVGQVTAELQESGSKVTGTISLGRDDLVPGFTVGKHEIASAEPGVKTTGAGARQFTYYVGQIKGIMYLDGREGFIHASLQLDQPITSGPFVERDTKTGAISGPTTTAWIREFTLSRGKYAVVFVHGIGGAWLESESGEELWPGVQVVGGMGQTHQGPLKLDPDGSPGPKIKATVIETIRHTEDIYGTFVKALEGAGYGRNQELFLFSYDWRLDNLRHVDGLEKMIGTALTTSRQSKVVLVTHSMGGLVCRAYLAEKGDAKVDKLVTIACPHLGAPKAYYAHLQGYTFGNKYANPFEMMSLGRNWPATYELQPWTRFVRSASNPPEYWSTDVAYAVSFNDVAKDKTYSVSTPYGGGGLVNWGKHTTFDGKLNPGLVRLADDFRRKLSGGPPAVPTYTIIACNQATLSGYEAHPWEAEHPGKSASVMSGGRLYYLKPVAENGDETVPLWSLEGLPAPAGGAPGKEVRFYVEGTHGGCTALPAVQEIVKGILDGSIRTPQDAKTKKGLETTREKVLKNLGDPGDKWRAEFEIHCPANLHVYDANGRHNGLNDIGAIEEDIPRSTLLRDEDRQYFFLFNATGPYHGRVAAYDAGEFTLALTARSPDKAKTLTYPHVKIEKDTVAEFDIPSVPGMIDNPPDLRVTTGGRQTTVKPQVTDAPPPDKPIDAGQQPGAPSTQDGTMPPFDSDVNLTDPVPVPLAKGLGLWAGSRSVLQGQVVWLPVYALQVNDLASLNAELGYAAAALRGEGARPSGQVSNMLFEGNTNEAGVVRLGWAGKRGMSGTEQIAAVGFRAVGAPGQRVPVRVKVTESVDSRGSPQPLATADGMILIVANRAWSSLDASRALKMSVGLLPEDRTLDVNADGRVTSRDAAAILQLASRRREQ